MTIIDDLYATLDPIPDSPESGTPAELVAWAFNAAWRVAQQKTVASTALFAQAQSAASAPTVFPAPYSFSPAVVEPPVDIPTHAAGVSQSEFESLAQSIVNQLAGEFSDYIDTHFPNNAALLAPAEAWLTNAITNGGTGINAAVEDQIWQRDRARVNAEADAAEDDLIAGWAAKGYDLPPGALLSSQSMLRKQAADRMAQASRDIAIKQAELEISNVRFAVEASMRQYSAALAAAQGYIQTLAVAPGTAANLTQVTANSQAQLISAASSYYQGRIGVQELLMKNAITPATWDQDARVKSAELTMAEIKVLTDAAIAAAQSLGTQAASALNGLHTSAGISASASNSVGYSYGNDTTVAVPPVTGV